MDWIEVGKESHALRKMKLFLFLHLSDKLASLSLPVIIIFTQNMNYCNLNFGGDFLVHQLKWLHCHDSLLCEYGNSTSVTGTVVIFS